MEKKRIITIGVHGNKPAEMPATASAWVEVTQEQGAVCFGVQQRREDDVERSLRWVCAELHSGSRFVVKEVDVELEAGGRVSLSWDREFSTLMGGLSAGEAWVAPDIAKVYDRLFLFEKVEDEKGMIFLLRGERGRPSRLRGIKPSHAPLVGRSNEINRLEELLEQIKVDQGQIVGFVGDAGIGKTRLTVALKHLLDEREIPYVEGNHVAGAASRYQGFQEIVTGLVGGKLETLSRWEMTDAETDYLRLFLEPDQKIERLAELTDEEIRQGLFFSVKKLIHSAARVPLVIILEDLHWADDSTLHLLDYVMDGMEASKLLLVLVYRPDLKPTWGKKLNYNELKLSPFVEAEVDQFIARLLGVSRVAPKVRRRLSKVSIGNPLFVEEMLRKFLDAGALQIETSEKGEKVLRMSEIGSTDIPTTLRALVASRFDRLEEEAKIMLRWASILGSAFEVKELKGLLDELESTLADEVLSELLEKSFLSERSVFPRQVNQFAHDLVFEVVRESIGDEEQMASEAKVGAFLERHYAESSDDTIDRIATHYLRSGNDKEAIRMALRAGHVAADRYRYPRAVFLFSEALQRWEKRSEKDLSAEEVYAPLVQSLLAVGELARIDQVLKKWQNWVAETKSAGSFSLSRLLMSYHLEKGEFRQAVSAADKALTWIREDESRQADWFKIARDRVDAYTHLGRINDAVHAAFEALRKLNTGELPEVRIGLWGDLAKCAVISGDPNVALEYLEKAESLLSSDVSPKVQLDLINRIGLVYENLGRFSDAVTNYTKAIEVALGAGLRQEEARAKRARGAHAVEDGNYALGLSDYRSVLEEARQIRDRALELRVATNIVDTLLDLFALDEADRLWTSLVEFQKENTEPWQTVRQMMLDSYFAHLRGDLSTTADLRSKVARMYEDLGERSQARRILSKSIRSELEAKRKGVKELTALYDEKLSDEHRVHSQMWYFERSICAFELASQGGKPDPAPDPNLNPMDCPIIWLRQQLFVAKIRWLDAKGDEKEAVDLRRVYEKERQRIAERVPAEYRENFFQHPLYRVPNSLRGEV